MTEFENIVIGKSSVPALIITIILMIAIPVAFFLYWRRKHKEQTNISYLIAGALGFIVSARILELGVHHFCILADMWIYSRERTGPLTSKSTYRAMWSASAFWTRKKRNRRITLRSV